VQTVIVVETVEFEGHPDFFGLQAGFDAPDLGWQANGFGVIGQIYKSSDIIGQVEVEIHFWQKHPATAHVASGDVDFASIELDGDIKLNFHTLIVTFFRSVEECFEVIDHGLSLGLPFETVNRIA